jgi:hypothetical protein
MQVQLRVGRVSEAHVETAEVSAAQPSTTTPSTCQMTTALIIHPQASMILAGLSMSRAAGQGLAQEPAAAPDAAAGVEQTCSPT